MNRALLVIDVQDEYFSGLLPVTHPAGSLDNILRAMDGAHLAGLPVVLVRHTSPQENSAVFRKNSPGWELLPQVAQRPHDLLINKNLPGSFTGTNLEPWLRERGVETVVIAGYMTQMCCDTTARQAVHRGFGVEFLSDATGTLDIANPAGRRT
jgi:nicotinamidase-related amidase